MSLIPMVSFTNRQAITVAATVGTTPGNTSTSHVINLPSNIQLGDLLVVFAWFNNGTLTTPSGWTLFSGSTTATNMPDIWKYADGTEGSTLTITSTVSEPWSGMAYRITGVDPSHTAPEMQFTTGTSTTPDPPSITPSWGSSVNSLYLAVYGGSGANTLVSFPVGYTTGQITVTNAASAAVAKKASPENPGVYTITPSTSWLTRTVACKGAF